LFDFELVEGKDHPNELPPLMYVEFGKTGGLLLRLTKTIRGTGQYVILDSGFCVLKEIIGLRQHGVFSGALIKKRRYWPALVPGDAIDQYFEDKPVGATGSVRGMLDGVSYNIFCLKDQGYVTKIMATGSGLFYNSDRMHSRAAENGNVQFKYPEPFEWHYDYMHLIDDHNNKRHAVPSIEGSLKTQRWAMRCFQYLLATSETNQFLANQHLVWGSTNETTIIEFRRELAWDLILNPLLIEPVPNVIATRRQSNPLMVHNVVKCPPFTSHWNGRDFETASQFRYNQFTCKARGCKKRVRTYCVCTPGEWLCPLHFRVHLLEAAEI
jgi:hypothetical protein